MSALYGIILPVFILIAVGYLATWRGLISQSGVQGLMIFTQGFAIPCLLFRAIATIDLGVGFSWPLLVAFYAGAFSGFCFGFLGARWVGRSPEDAVAIGFCGLFSNSILLGLPITERAFGQDTLSFSYAIVSLHAPVGYLVGITAMEIARARGENLKSLPTKVARAMVHNTLVIGIVLGFTVNLTGVTIPGVIDDALTITVAAALPTALFGLGGVLYQYRPEGELTLVGIVCVASLVIHPATAYILGRSFGLSTDALRAAVLMAAVAPGVNAYVFANIYGRGRRTAASSVLISTVLCIPTIWIWLLILP